jgi:hypothetical protein
MNMARHAELLNTVKRGPSLCFKFGSTSYKMNRQQRDISEQGPKTAFFAKRLLGENGEKTQGLVAYRSGTGRVVFLATTKPGMDNLNWTITFHNSDAWQQKFSDIRTHLPDVLSVTARQ